MTEIWAIFARGMTELFLSLERFVERYTADGVDGLQEMVRN